MVLMRVSAEVDDSSERSAMAVGSELSSSHKIVDSSKKHKNAVAGAIAGSVTAAILHPLDIVKTRFQVSDGLDKTMPHYKNTWNALVTIAQKERLKGLYAGITPALLANGVSWGVYFFFYSRAKERYTQLSTKPLGMGLQIASAVEAGVLTSLITHPLWLLKTRLQLQVPTTVGMRAGPPPYQNALDAVQSIWRQEKMFGFFRGLGPSLVLVSHGVIQMTSYEEMKKMVIRVRAPTSNQFSKGSQGGDVLGAKDYFALGFSSKTVAVLTTYPFQVVRSRLQQRPDGAGQLKYANGWKAAQAIARHEGWRGFFKGFVPHILRVAPGNSLTFLVYELMLKLLN